MLKVTTMVTTKLQQCNDEGDTMMAMTKWWQTPQQCDDEGDTVMVTIKPQRCDSKGTTMTQLRRWHRNDAMTKATLWWWQWNCNNATAKAPQRHDCDNDTMTMQWQRQHHDGQWQNRDWHKGDTVTAMTNLQWCDSEGNTMMWQQQQHSCNVTMMMIDRWIGSIMVAHMFLFYKQWKFVFNSLYCNSKKKRIVYSTIIVPHSQELGHYTALCDAIVAAA